MASQDSVNQCYVARIDLPEFVAGIQILVQKFLFMHPILYYHKPNSANLNVAKCLYIYVRIDKRKNIYLCILYGINYIQYTSVF